MALKRDVLTHLRLSIADYCRIIDDIAAFKVTIESTHKATVAYQHPHPPPAPVRAPSDASAARQQPPAEQDPFFVVDLKIVNGMVNFTMPPEEFEKVPLAIFDAALQVAACLNAWVGAWV